MKLKLCVVMIVFTACAVPSKSSNPTFLTGNGDGKTSSEKIKSDLTRGFGVFAAYNYGLSVYPVTDALIIAEENEKGQKAMDSPDVITRAIESSKKDFTKGRTCFLFVLDAGTIEMAQFKHWRAKLKDSNSTMHEITFRNVKGMQSVPYTTGGSGGFDWQNNSYGCVDKQIELTKTFTIYMIPQLESLKTSELTWVGQGSTKPK